MKSDPRKTTPWLHREGLVNGIRLHWVQAGRSDDPLVVLLHGFPEFWYSWRSQIVALASAGYRVVAPDLRGYNLSEKPPTGYDLDTLSQDCMALIQSLTDSKCYLVGHDWGGTIAWATAARFPNKIAKLVILNAPHMPKLHFDSLSWQQRLCLWYVAFFQCPYLPELLGGCNRGWLLAQIMQHTSNHSWDPATVELYRDSYSQPRALHCMLAYYRNIHNSMKQSLNYDKIKVPTLILWGKQDAFLKEELCANMQNDWVQAPLEMVTLDCGHWTQQEVPDHVNRQLLLFFANNNKS